LVVEAEVRAALEGVEEPELRLPMLDLGMVTGVAVDGDTAVVAVALPLTGDDRAQAVHGAIAEAVLAGTDAQRVEVDLRKMTNDEKTATARVLKGPKLILP